MAGKRKASSDAAAAGASPPVRVGRLDTIEGVRRELDRLYRVARRQAGAAPDAAVAAKLAYLLQMIGRVVESDVEARLARLEAMLGERG
jgi:hypothetical protein